MVSYALSRPPCEGDLIFIAIDNFLYRRVAAATRGWASHVGIVFQDGSNWVVYESTIPRSRITPLDQFLNRAGKGQFALQRFQRPFNADEISALRDQASQRLGRLYHLGFNYDSSREYCSKYVFDVFRDALNIEVGRLETAADLIEANPDESRRFWRWWFLGRIPYQRRLVTPQSQLDDPDWTTIATHISNDVGC